MASIPNFEELDDVLFGVSTRHQWNQLITQIEATNHANKNGSKKAQKKVKNVLQEQNREVFPAGQEQDQKGGAKVCHINIKRGTFLYMSFIIKYKEASKLFCTYRHLHNMDTSLLQTVLSVAKM